jgi:hypothetical protein
LNCLQQRWREFGRCTSLVGYVASAQVAYLADPGEGSAANVSVNKARGERVAGTHGICDFHHETAVAMSSGAVGEQAAVRPERDGDEAALRRQIQQRLGGDRGGRRQFIAVGSGREVGRDRGVAQDSCHRGEFFVTHF